MNIQEYLEQHPTVKEKIHWIINCEACGKKIAECIPYDGDDGTFFCEDCMKTIETELGGK